MKKGKVLGKTQLTVAIMVLALGSAIWLNTKYLPSGTKYLGEASFVGNTSGEKAVETSAKAEDNADYFTMSKKERKNTREEAIEQIQKTLKNDNLSEKDKKSAIAKTEEIAMRMEQEGNIETLLKAKGFQKAVVVMSDTGVNVVVKSEGLTSQQTLQIQDIVMNETNISLGNIKIIPIK